MKILITLFSLTIFLGITAEAQVREPTETAMDRFLRYVKIDTQSAEDQSTVPSTAKQFTLAHLLEGELVALGAADVRVSDTCIVYARIPGNLPDNSAVPVIGFLAHMDTSPQVSGAG